MSETSAGVPWFAANLKQAREAAGLTQQELVGRVRRDTGRPFSQQTYSKIETGAQEPTLSVLLSLARNTGADVDFLTRPPQETQAALEIVNAMRQTREALQSAQSAAAQFRYWQQELRRLAGKHGVAAAGNEVADTLALTLDLEEE